MQVSVQARARTRVCVCIAALRAAPGTSQLCVIEGKVP